MPEPLLFLFDDGPEGRVFLRAGDPPGLIRLAERGAGAPPAAEGGRVTRGAAPCDLWAVPKPGADLSGYVSLSRRDLPALFGYEIFNRAGIAYQMMNLLRHNRFCGACGEPMRDHAADRARECPACGNLVFPVLSPAIIVAVQKDGMLLMGHGVNFPSGRYSVLAGFVEPGETLEEAVVREVYEESRVRVTNVRYFGSQPWPFPASMMLGFTADWESGDPEPGDGELSDVRWFAPKTLPEIPPSVSISRRLIDDWLASVSVKRIDDK